MLRVFIFFVFLGSGLTGRIKPQVTCKYFISENNTWYKYNVTILNSSIILPAYNTIPSNAAGISCTCHDIDYLQKNNISIHYNTSILKTFQDIRIIRCGMKNISEIAGGFGKELKFLDLRYNDLQVIDYNILRKLIRSNTPTYLYYNNLMCGKRNCPLYYFLLKQEQTYLKRLPQFFLRRISFSNNNTYLYHFLSCGNKPGHEFLEYQTKYCRTKFPEINITVNQLIAKKNTERYKSCYPLVFISILCSCISFLFLFICLLRSICKKYSCTKQDNKSSHNYIPLIPSYTFSLKKHRHPETAVVEDHTTSANSPIVYIPTTEEKKVSCSRRK
ncbi:pI329L [African swine fever virus]|nr:pI329L [African swine fever virus]